MKIEQKKTCAICGEEFTGFGANPEPFGGKGDRCCSDCDETFVIPVRILLGRNFGNEKMLHFLTRLAETGKLVKVGRRMVSAQRKVPAA